MNTYALIPVGQVHVTHEHFALHVDPAYRPALQALDGFSHVQVLCWFHEMDTPEARQIVQTPQPYKHAPESMGIFATRAPVRPNPIALSSARILHIDHTQGILTLDYIDAHDGTPLLDIKPYTPSIDRIESPSVPQWCAHWPKNVESSGDFDWESELLF